MKIEQADASGLKLMFRRDSNVTQTNRLFTLNIQPKGWMKVAEFSSNSSKFSFVKTGGEK